MNPVTKRTETAPHLELSVLRFSLQDKIWCSKSSRTPGRSEAATESPVCLRPHDMTPAPLDPQ